MRVLYIADDPIRNSGAVREHVRAMCVSFRKIYGYVTLVCPSCLVEPEEIGADRIVCYGNYSSLKRVIQMNKVVSELLRTEECNFVYMRYRASQLILYMSRVISKATYFLEINGVPELEMNVGKLKKLSIRLIQHCAEKGMFLKARGIITVTTQIKDYYENKYGLSDSKVLVCNNGVWPERYHAKDLSKPEARKVTVIGFVGNVTWWQGLDIVIKVISTSEFRCRVKLVIVGDGDYLSVLKELSHICESDNVVFYGSVPSSKIPYVLKDFDIGIVSKSLVGEGFSPLKLYEYWAAGLPVIATNLPGLDIVEKVNGGLLYEIKDLESLTDRIRVMLRNRSLWSTWGWNGRRYIEMHASWHKIGEKTNEFINKQL